MNDTVSAISRFLRMNVSSLAFSLSSLHVFRFRVDDTGTVYVNVAADEDLTQLDREMQDTHYLNFEAIDGGNLRTSVPLEVTLLDVNDNAPQILRDVYEGYVQENSATLERPLSVEVRRVHFETHSLKIFENKLFTGHFCVINSV